MQRYQYQALQQVTGGITCTQRCVSLPKLLYPNCRPSKQKLQQSSVSLLNHPASTNTSDRVRSFALLFSPAFSHPPPPRVITKILSRACMLAVFLPPRLRYLYSCFSSSSLLASPFGTVHLSLYSLPKSNGPGQEFDGLLGDLTWER